MLGTDRPVVLLIQEEEETAHLVRFLLEREGFDVTHLADGRQAGARIQSGPLADAVVLGMKLPHASGLDLLQKFRSHSGWRDVPVLMLTADGREEDIVQALEMGADDYIVKPFNPREMVSRVRRRLRRLP